jgi:prepilin-type N-terminal cleavage/methylation domain-containing protein
MIGHSHRESGFTLIELLIAIVVIAILSGLVLGSLQGTQAKARDNERAADIDNIRSKLEQYYSDNGGYPHTLSTSLLAVLDPSALVDPGGVSIAIVSPAADQAAARAVASPTSSANYKYIPYPTGCSTITCTGYVLKTYIEQPTAVIPNPYAVYGLNNN